jgi:hypothetical protein
MEAQFVFEVAIQLPAAADKSQPLYPCPTLQVTPDDRPRMARGQDGCAIPFPYDSSICGLMPVYPERYPRRSVYLPARWHGYE